MTLHSDGDDKGSNVLYGGSWDPYSKREICVAKTFDFILCYFFMNSNKCCKLCYQCKEKSQGIAGRKDKRKTMSKCQGWYT